MRGVANGTGVVGEVVLDYLSGVQSAVPQTVVRSMEEVPQI